MSDVNELIDRAELWLDQDPDDPKTEQVSAAVVAMLRGLTDGLRAERAEVERLRAEADANWPCDGGCNYNDGPDETCSRHGRRVSEVWQMEQDALARAERAEADRDAAREVATLAQGEVIALRDENRRLTAQLQEVRERFSALEERTGGWPQEICEAAAILDAAADEPKPCTCGWGGVHDPDNPRCERNGGK